ncbi:protein kinase domain-containing protein [Streptomyces parvus]|uniref:protein kinase domain-containing protein n=1 Tax=Streptomyces parvus TaxID=66428 RepID=UPI003675FE6B
MPGPTLAAEVGARGPLDQDELLRLATEAATALAAIHQAGVVHRDLKPGNVLLGPDGPRIIDFGIARAPDMSLTATGAIMGTLGYMAPEVLSGQRATEVSGVFAWAAVVLYAATATEPLRGENIAEVAHRTATVAPDLAALPSEIRTLMAAALAKEPQHRPTASDLLLGLVGAPVPSSDPRAALMKAGARKAADPAAADSGGGPEAGAGHTVVEAPLGERAEAAFSALAPAAQLAAHELLLRLIVPGSATNGSQDSVRTAEPAEMLAGRPRERAERRRRRRPGSRRGRKYWSPTPTALYGRSAPPCCPPGGGCARGPTPTGRASPASNASAQPPACGRRTASGRRTCCAATSCATAPTGCRHSFTTCGPTRWNSASSPAAAPLPPTPPAAANCLRASQARGCSPCWRAAWRGRRTARPSGAGLRQRPERWRRRRKASPVRSRRPRNCSASPPGGSPGCLKRGRRSPRRRSSPNSR